jgi:hypothetical protein
MTDRFDGSARDGSTDDGSTRDGSDGNARWQWHPAMAAPAMTTPTTAVPPMSGDSSAYIKNGSTRQPR